MQAYRTILIIGWIEILIGGVTLFVNTVALFFGSNTKSFGVLCFVYIASMISTMLGIGLLTFRKRAYDLLIYFSSVILISKLLIFLNIIQLNGALETTIPASTKNFISTLYHAAIIYYLTHVNVKKIYNPD